MTRSVSTVGQQRTALGRYGNSLAARHLVEQGMVLLDQSWRGDLGGIDLVLHDGRVLVVCAVKTRSVLAVGQPWEAVTEPEAAGLRRLAARWLRQHEVRPDAVRIDLVGVLVPSHLPVSVEHSPGVA